MRLSRPERVPGFICLISNRRALTRRPSEAGLIDRQIEAMGLAARAGCDLIQIREKDLAAGELLDMTRRAIEASRPHGTRLLVNDRLDVALAAGADGVHLPVSSLPPAEVREITDRLGLPEFLIGVSTHSIEEALDAEAQGADFIVSGPVFETASKKACGPPMGLERFSDICSRLEIPVLGLGGITIGNFRRVIEAGAAGIAGIGIFSDLETIELNIRALQTNVAV
ncbi:MAG: thiamine phosphate synthase [Acidobacteriota bacterium]|nr:MAG: thiamine phosphate synthase [Acidobacteriota bacterium]